MSEELGILIGVTKPDEVTFESRRPVSIGEYVILDYGGDKVLGLVERSIKVTKGMCAFLVMLMN
jgi:hypothetical protein